MKRCYMVLSIALLLCAVFVIDAGAEVINHLASDGWYGVDSAKWGAYSPPASPTGNIGNFIYGSFGKTVSWDISVVGGYYTVGVGVYNDTNRAPLQMTVDGGIIGTLNVPSLPLGYAVYEVGEALLSTGTHTFRIDLLLGSEYSEIYVIRLTSIALTTEADIDAIYELLDSDADGDLTDETVGMTAAQKTKLNAADSAINAVDGILDRLEALEAVVNDLPPGLRNIDRDADGK